jgi:hypothetical protein
MDAHLADCYATLHTRCTRTCTHPLRTYYARTRTPCERIDFAEA